MDLTLHHTKRVYFENSLILIISLLFGILFWLSYNNYGPGLYPDSIRYVSVARSFQENLTFHDYNEQELTVWPPLYPLIIFLISSLDNHSVLTNIGFLNALSFFLILYLTGMLLIRMTSLKLAILAILFIGSAKPFWFAMVFMSSEGPFVTLIAISLFLLYRYIINPNWQTLLFLSLTCELAWLTRYLGITLLVTVSLSIVFSTKLSIKDKLKNLFAYNALATLPMVIWVIRNYLLTETLFGPRSEAAQTFWSNITLILKTFGLWQIQGWGELLPYAMQKIFIAVVLILLFLFVLFLIFKRSGKSLKDIDTISLLFIGIYCTTLVISASKSQFDLIGDRLLAPIMVPFFWFFFSSVDRIVKRFEYSYKYWVRIFIFSMLVVLCGRFVSVTYFALSVAKSGIGYESPYFSESSIISTLQSEAYEKVLILSNAKDLLYWYLGAGQNKNIKWCPTGEADLSSALLDVTNRSICIAFFSSVDRNHLCNPTFVNNHIKTFKYQSEFKDGSIICNFQQ